MPLFRIAVKVTDKSGTKEYAQIDYEAVLPIEAMENFNDSVLFLLTYKLRPEEQSSMKFVPLETPYRTRPCEKDACGLEHPHLELFDWRNADGNRPIIVKGMIEQAYENEAGMAMVQGKMSKERISQ